MKVKDIKVEIKPLSEVLGDAARVMSAARKGEHIKPKKGMSFGDVESFRQFFTPKRIELLQVIKHKQPESIYELAKLTGREFKSVVTDMKILEKYGLIDTKKTPIKGGYKIRPIFDYDKLSVDIAM
ncbi:MAG: ArsR family transcriptional regulator [Nanoarchaeota archaeon]|nr:ArsR family transcriptional regulator [Nanoarchaeota archaeon]MBU1005506.1 ArsR family transcriptional regulator [Nanoarchaeota archaeon]